MKAHGGAMAILWKCRIIRIIGDVLIIRYWTFAFFMAVTMASYDMPRHGHGPFTALSWQYLEDAVGTATSMPWEPSMG